MDPQVANITEAGKSSSRKPLSDKAIQYLSILEGIHQRSPPPTPPLTPPQIFRWLNFTPLTSRHPGHFLVVNAARVRLQTLWKTSLHRRGFDCTSRLFSGSLSPILLFLGELGIIEFNIQEGEKRCFYRVIDPGMPPSGCGVDFLEKSVLTSE